MPVLLMTNVHKQRYFVSNHVISFVFCSSKFVVDLRELDIQIRVSESRLLFLFLPKSVLIIHFTEICSKMVTKFIINLKSFVGCITVLLREIQVNVDTEQTQ
jgi:hypothetical protein